MNTPHHTRYFPKRQKQLLSTVLIFSQIVLGTFHPPMMANAAKLDSASTKTSSQPAELTDFSGSVESIFAAIGDKIQGVVFQDNNGNGVDDGLFEAGFANIGVKVFNVAGMEVGSATTDNNGNYSITTSTAGPYRVELATLPTGLYEGVHGTGAATSVRFVPDGGGSNINFGINYPAAYCQNTPNVVTNIYFQDSAVDGSNTGSAVSITSFPYSASGNAYVQRDLAIQQQAIGTTWGLAYRRSTHTLYSSSYFKRFAPVGPDGLGAIYRIEPASSAGSATLFTSLDALLGAGTTGPNLHNFSIASDYQEVTSGTVTNTFDAVGKVGLGDLDINDDETRLYTINLFDRKLYEIPLNQTPTAGNLRSSAIPLSQNSLTINPCPIPTTSIRPFALKFYQGALYVGMVCNGEGARDSGEQATWVDSNSDGYFNSNESFTDQNGNGQFDFDFPDGLFAYVYRVNPATLAFETNPVLSLNLAFDRGEVNGKTGLGDWAPWASVPTARVHSLMTYPQPILSDIEFDNGNMILGFRDRFGDQSGDRVHFFNNDATLYRSSNGGDILRACGNPQSGWTVESNGACGGADGAGKGNKQGPGGGEFYEDFFDKILAGDSDGIPNHQEIVVGGLANHSGNGEIVATAFDPVNFYSQGIRWFNNSTGATAKSFEVLIDSGNGFGKAAGIGDVELLCSPAPTEIGNRIWRDKNQNGIQDPDEPPIAGVTVRLYNSSGVLTGTAVTNADGLYYFGQRADLAADNNLADEVGFVLGGLQPNSPYQIRLDNINNFVLQQGPLNGLNLTIADATGAPGGSDQSDSDAQMVATLTGIAGTWPTIVVTTTIAGANNHSLDFGFTADVALSIGNQVWYDFDNDRVIDPTEKGVPGIVVDLFHDADGNGALNGTEQTPITSTKTVTNGFYLFTQSNGQPLVAGQYAVGINPANFTGSGVLVSYHSSGAHMSANASITETIPANPGNSADNDDNGGKQTTGFYAGGVLSPIANLGVPAPGQEASTNAQGTLAFGQTPFWSDPNPDASSNLTIDFGFYQVGLGNRVILDLNNNEKREFLLEVGLNGVTMTLWTAAGAAVNIGPDGILGTFDDSQGNATLSRFDGFTGGLYEMKGLAEGDYIVKLVPPFTSELPLGAEYPGQPVQRLVSSNKNLPGVEAHVDSDDVYINNDDNGFPDPADPNNLITGLPATVQASIGAESTPDKAQTLNTYYDFMLAIPILPNTYSLGNRVFADLNNDGVFDPTSEPGIPGAKLRLHNMQTSSTTQMTRTTDANGFYRFDNIPAGNYLISVIEPDGYASSSGGPGANTGFASANMPSNEWDSVDDGVRVSAATGITLVRSLTITLGAGASEVITETDLQNDVLFPHGAPNDHSDLTVDFGFVLAQPLSLGNFVWDDRNNNGTFDKASEQGIADVEIALYLDTNGDKFMGSDERSIPYLTTTTTITGYYLFTGLPPASYEVELMAKNFKPGGPLEDYRTSTGINGSASGPYEDGALDPDSVTTDQADKGRTTTNTVSEFVIRTRTLDLSKGTEPVGEDPNNDPGQLDADSNLTIDFGVYKPLSLGNRVWLDMDNNGKQDDVYVDWAGNPIPLGIPGVSLRLFTDTISLTPIATAKSDLDGYYRFDNLIPGQYLVEVAASNFQNGGPLTVPQEFVLIEGQPDPSSDDIGSTANVNNSTDKDDNGIGSSYSPLNGIRSALVTLEYEGVEPTAETDLSASGQGSSDARANMTVDFGFYEPVVIGNYIWYDSLNKGKVALDATGVSDIDVRVFLDANNDNVADSAIPYSTTNTGATGFYTFFLKPGNWLVEFDLPTGFGSSSGQPGQSPWEYEGPTMPDPDDPVEAGGNLDQQDRGSQVAGTRIVRSKSVTVLPRTEIIEDVLDTNLNAYMGMDFGIVYPLSLGNLVWEDVNNNGVVDNGEPGTAEVVMNLYLDSDRNGQLSNEELQTPLITTTTNSQGFYIFSGLAAGDYLVEIAAENFAAAGALFGAQSSSGVEFSSFGPYEAAPDPDNDINSDDNGTVAISGGNKVVRSALIALQTDPNTGFGVEPTGDEDVNDGLDTNRLDSDSNVTLDFGFWRPFSLGNRVWLDMDNNGKIDSAEPGIRGVEVTLYTITGTKPIASQITDSNGYYRFDDLLAGTYRVVIPRNNFVIEEDLVGPLVGLRSSAPDEASPDSNGDSNDNGLGLLLDPPDGVRSEMVTLGLDGAEPLSEGDLATSGQGNSDAFANMTVDFGFYRPIALGDKVWFDTNDNGTLESNEMPVAGLPLVLWKADAKGTPLSAVMTTTTQSDGCYFFLDLAPIDYVVQIAPSRFAANGQLFGYLPSDVRDSDPSDAVNDNTAAKVGNLGVLSSRVNLTYTLQPTNESTCGPLPSYDDNNVNQTVDIGLYKLELGNRVWLDTVKNGTLDPSEQGVSGVTVTLLDNFGTAVMTTTTDATGNYTLTSVVSGTYRVRITAPLGYYSCSDDGSDPNGNIDGDDNGVGNSNSPIESLPITLTPGNEVTSTPTDGKTVNPTLDFCLLPLAAIGNYTWLDINGNGIQETGESPIAGITVTLLANGNAISTTVTDAKGLYKFERLTPGDYALHFDSATGYVQTQQDAGSDDASDSDVDPFSGNTVITTLDPGEDDPTWDAGFTYPAAIGNYVWFDADRDGLFDSTEPPLISISVTLYITRGGEAIPVATQLTDHQGEFYFGNLPPGKYLLHFAASGPAEFTTEGNDSDANPTSGTTGGILLAPGDYKILGAGFVVVPPMHIPTQDDITDEPQGVQNIFLPLVSNQ